MKKGLTDAKEKPLHQGLFCGVWKESGLRNPLHSLRWRRVIALALGLAAVPTALV